MSAPKTYYARSLFLSFFSFFVLCYVLLIPPWDLVCLLCLFHIFLCAAATVISLSNICFFHHRIFRRASHSQNLNCDLWLIGVTFSYLPSPVQIYSLCPVRRSDGGTVTVAEVGQQVPPVWIVTFPSVLRHKVDCACHSSRPGRKWMMDSQEM